MATLRAVAAEANVSQSTASKVLNNVHDAQIPDTTKNRVREAAIRVGYHPSAIARGLAGKRMNTIGVIMAYDQDSVTSDPYLGPCLDGILDVNKRNRQKTVLFTEDDWEEALRHVPSYCDGHCDGLMLIIPRATSEIVEALRTRTGRRVPFLLVGDSRIDDQLVAVDVDSVTSARNAVTHLVTRGHRRIAAFCGNADFLSNTQRLEGYRLALEDAGIPYDPALIFDGEYFREAGFQNTLRLLERAETMDFTQRPTAIFGFNDKIAFGAMDALRERNVRVPEQISVMGFDDIAEAASAGLTTVRHDVRAVGRSAAETLLRLIEGKVSAGHREWVAAPVIERTSIADAPVLS
jgi:DNA-binding LacI/PurR family transcriptional regulator